MIPVLITTCAVTYTVDAPGWSAEIAEAIGTVSLASGITFTVSDPDAATLHIRSLPNLLVGPDAAYLGASYADGTIELADAGTVFTYMPKQRRVIVMHELMHQLGMPHSADPQSVMYPFADWHVFRPSPGDVAGMAAVGAELGCA